MPDIGRAHSAKETRGEPLSDGGKSQRQYRSPNRMGCFCIEVLCGRGVRAAEDGTRALAHLLIGLALLWVPLSQPNPGASAVLVDELHSGRFESAAAR